MTTITDRVSRKTVYSTSSSTVTRTRKTRITYRGPLVKGAWITFPNGYRFRRQTSWGCSSVRLEPHDSGSWLGRRDSDHTQWDGTESAGGLSSWNFMESTWGSIWNTKLSMSNIFSPPLLVTDEKNESTTKALNKIADQKANLGENIATLGQTARLFVSPVKAFVERLKAVPKPTIRGVKTNMYERWIHMSYRDFIRGGFPKPFAEAYLAYIYGFAPLMGDIHGISELLKEQGKRPLLLHSRGTSYRKSSSGGYTYKNVSDEANEWIGNASFESRSQCTLWAKLKDDYQLTRTLNQLGLLNPASLVWELVPYSFVVDWILPIGPVLTAMTAPAGLDFVTGSQSRRLSGRWDAKTSHYKDGYSKSSSRDGTSTIHYEGYRRDAISTWPTPGLWFCSDPLGIHRDGSDRIFKALALTVAQIPNLR